MNVDRPLKVDWRPPKTLYRILAILSASVLLGGVLLVVLLVQLKQTQDDLAEARAAGTSQRAEQTVKLDEATRKLDVLAAQIVQLTADNAAKDSQIAGQAQTIRMLTAILTREGISIPADLQQRVDAGTSAPNSPPVRTPQPSATPSAVPTSPAPVAPTPQPSPTDTSLVGGVTSLLCLLVPFAC